MFIESLSLIGPFRLFDLPMELITSILRLATTSASSYASLMTASHSVQALVQTECVPETLVLLGYSAASFYECLKISPAVGKRVKRLWLASSLPSRRMSVVAPVILNACYRMEKIATYPDVLMFLCNEKVSNTAVWLT